MRRQVIDKGTQQFKLEHYTTRIRQANSIPKYWLELRAMAHLVYYMKILIQIEDKQFIITGILAQAIQPVFRTKRYLGKFTPTVQQNKKVIGQIHTNSSEQKGT